MDYTTKYTVINLDNGEVMGCNDLDSLEMAVEGREDFQGARLRWVLTLDGEDAITKLRAIED